MQGMTTAAMTDEQLVEQALNGIDAGFNLLVERYYQSVFRVALGISGSREDAEEIAQETFLKAFKNLKTYSPDKAVFKTWLFTIARNESLNLVGAFKRKVARFFSESYEDRYDSHTDPNAFRSYQRSAESLLVEQQQLAAVDRAVKELPERQRTALLLKVYEELSYKEISEIMDVSPSSVESLIFRARKTIMENVST